MGSTLEKLLSIQGASEQLSMEAFINDPPGAQEPAKSAALEEIHPAAKNAQESPSEAQEGKPLIEAWRAAYKIFVRYYPALKKAAALDDGEAGTKLFQAALVDVREILNMGGDADIIGVRLWNMLDDVWRKGTESRDML